MGARRRAGARRSRSSFLGSFVQTGRLRPPRGTTTAVVAGWVGGGADGVDRADGAAPLAPRHIDGGARGLGWRRGGPNWGSRVLERELGPGGRTESGFQGSGTGIGSDEEQSSAGPGGSGFGAIPRALSTSPRPAAASAWRPPEGNGPRDTSGRPQRRAGRRRGLRLREPTPHPTNKGEHITCSPGDEAPEYAPPPPATLCCGAKRRQHERPSTGSVRACRAPRPSHRCTQPAPRS